MKKATAKAPNLGGTNPAGRKRQGTSITHPDKVQRLTSIISNPVQKYTSQMIFSKIKNYSVERNVTLEVASMHFLKLHGFTICKCIFLDSTPSMYDLKHLLQEKGVTLPQLLGALKRLSSSSEVFAKITFNKKGVPHTDTAGGQRRAFSFTDLDCLKTAYERAQTADTLVEGKLVMEEPLSSTLNVGYLTELEYDGINVVIQLEKDTRIACEWTLGTPTECNGSINTPGTFQRMSLLWNEIPKGDGDDQEWHLDFELSVSEPVLPGPAQNMACICAVSKDGVGIRLQPSGHVVMERLASELAYWGPDASTFVKCVPNQVFDIQVEMGYCLIFDARLPHKGLKGVKGVFAPRLHRYVVGRTTPIQSYIGDDGEVATWPMHALSRLWETEELGPLYKKLDNLCSQ